jgi:hypothetical protein
MVAVDYQDFTDEVQEYAFITSDNAISEWAELDMKMITESLTEFGPEFTDLELLGMKNIESLKDVFFEEPPSTNGDKREDTKCPNCGETFNAGDYKS